MIGEPLIAAAIRFGKRAANSVSGARTRRDASHARELAMDSRDTLHLSLGGEAFVETFIAKLACLLTPGRQFFAPPFDATLNRFRVLCRQIRADP
jgi:hypothetical protein